jgi:hypothetical protein
MLQYYKQMKTGNILSCEVAEELGILANRIKNRQQFSHLKAFVDIIRF